MKLIFLLTSFLMCFSAQATEAIKHHYIIKVAAAEDPALVARSFGLRPKFLYRQVFKGFASVISDAVLAEMARDKRVLQIEEDKRVFAHESNTLDLSWGLDRIDQRALPLDGTFRPRATGKGVTAYVIDTGIRYDHEEFNGQASMGYDVYGTDGSDCYGHGTHVAGTLAGKFYGVARDVSIKSVKVLDCNGSGTLSGFISGIDWIAQNSTGPSVANMSLGFNGVSALADAAVEGLINKGVTTIVSAGNSNRDACNYSPARVPSAITIGATNTQDGRATFSNFGSCVDLFAPGDKITSAWHLSPTAVQTLKGTSMSSPHVSGVVAQFLEGHPDATPQEVREFLMKESTKGAVTNAASTNNHLLFSL